MEIRDKVAVITGAASGIGNAVCAELARREAKCIAMVDLSESVVARAKEINEACGRETALPFCGDVTSGEFRSQVFDALCEAHQVVNICVPAAGIVRDALAVKVNRSSGEPEMYPVEVFRQVTEINLIAPVYWAMETVARVARYRHHQGLKRWGPSEEMQGAIIFIGSVASQGNKGQISYAATKAGLEGAAATLMKEAIFHGVRCGVIHPGFTDTPILGALGEEYLEKHVLPETQLGRLIRPEEIADAICFMISNQAVSGELWADAGWHPAAA
ncbi:MAG: SDR family NAD(P)-dependent oxidoreductase [Gammaproteobacteria bacterium]|nr:SDR family NAD(P)-dependent oxidoreductase [Gammaproteobacteria bacterium]